MRPDVPVLTCLALLAACSGGAAPRGTPATRPSATTPGGAVASILCRTHRVEIESNERALATDEAAGDRAAAAAVRVKIRAGITAARAIPGCNVDDLPLR